MNKCNDYDVIFICPTFFNYEEKYKKALSEFVSVKSVFYVESEVLKCKLAFNKKFFCFVISWLINKLDFSGQYVSRHLKILGADVFKNRTQELSLRIKNELENVTAKKCVIVKGFGITEQVISYIREQCDVQEVIMYQWDSLNRYPIMTKVYEFYDKIYTFDPLDLSAYPGSRFLSTASELPELNSKLQPSDYKYDFCYVGSYTPDRFLILCKLADYLKAINLKYKFVLIKQYGSADAYHEIIQNATFSEQDLLTLYNYSKALVELAHEGQAGFTQRVFTGISLNKKIVLINGVDDVVKKYYSNYIGYFNDKSIFYMSREELIYFLSESINSDNVKLVTYRAWAEAILEDK